MPTDSKVDWMSEHYRRIITDQRRWLYNDDWFEWAMREHIGVVRQSACADSSGQTPESPGNAGESRRSVLDVGCGTGYLAFKLAALDETLGVTGVDNNDMLLAEAMALNQSDFGGRLTFVTGNCYELPFADSSFDFVCASTLLLHMTEPVAALREMARVVKPGGMVFVCEPDNFASFPSGFDRATEPDGVDFDWTARRFDYALKLYRGKIVAGEGDSAIARRLPILFGEAGLDVVFFRKSDRFLALVPPYDTDEKRALADNLRITLSEENCRRFFPQLLKEYVAGGGTDEEFDEFWNERLARQRAMLDALEAGTLVWTSNHTLAICAGRKRAPF